MVRKSLHTWIVILLALYLPSQHILLKGIEAGKNMPSLRINSWFSKGMENSQSPWMCVTLFDVTGRDSLPMLRMLETLQGRFGFPFSAIAVNNSENSHGFFRAHGPFTIAVAQDEMQRNRNILAAKESLFPYCILVKDGVVQWTGHPSELESVITLLQRGTFSLAKQREVESLRRELQMAIQSGLPHVIGQTADKILAVSKGDRIAIQAKLMALNSSGRSRESLPFIRKVCMENPKDMQLRILEMDLLLRQGRGYDFVTAVERFVKDFSGKTADPSFVPVAAYVIENAPYGVLKPDLMLTLAQRAYSIAARSGKGTKKSISYAIACETLARVKAVFGEFPEAVRLQKEALAIRKGSRQEQAAQTRLRYYEALQKVVKK